MRHISHHTTLQAFFSICAAMMLTMSAGCRHHEGESDPHNHGDTEADAGKEVGHDGEIVLDEHRAGHLGVKTTAIEPAPFYETIIVDGRLEPAPSAKATAVARSAGILTLADWVKPGVAVRSGQSIGSVSGRGMAGGDPNEAARAAMNAAKRELDRITPLHADGIVSTKDYNAALQAYETARAAVGSNQTASGSAVTAPVSGIITAIMAIEGQGVEAGAPVAEISSGNDLVLVGNVPQRYAREVSRFTGAEFKAATSNEVLDIDSLQGKRIGSGSVPVSVEGFIPVYFSLKNNGQLTAGTFCEVYLHSGQRDHVLSLPLTALSEQQGEKFCYVQLDENCYEKRPLKLGQKSGSRVEVLSGLKSGEKVVTEGVTFVRLAETSGVVPEGHSHNH